MLKVFVYGNQQLPAIAACVATLKQHKDVNITENLKDADIAVAPMLLRILKKEELEQPRIGTLIFHPSLLPFYKGKDAIKDAFRNQEKTTGATWFWADTGIDSGDICEQMPLKIEATESPRQFYESKVIPAAVKMLEFVLDDLGEGIVRKRGQGE